jgi:hypothetical protein
MAGCKTFRILTSSQQSGSKKTTAMHTQYNKYTKFNKYKIKKQETPNKVVQQSATTISRAVVIWRFLFLKLRVFEITRKCTEPSHLCYT